jgi:predicted nucleotidyltransferase
MTEAFSKVAAELVKLTDSDCAAVLIGSAARGRRTEQSDIDILFIRESYVAPSGLGVPHQIQY